MVMQLGRKFRENLSQVWQRRTIGKIGAILLAIPAAFLALVLLGVTDVRQREQQIESDIRIIEQRVKTSERVLRYLIDQETGVRGYLLTLDEKFLQPYNAAAGNLYPAIMTLKQQSPDQSDILQQLEQLIQQRLRKTETLLDFARSTNLKLRASFLGGAKGILSPTETSKLLEQLNQGKQTTDEIRQTVETFKQRQQQILLQKQEQLHKSKQFVDRVQIMGALLSVLSYVGVVKLFQMLDHRMMQRDQEINQTQGTIQTLTSNLVDGVIMLHQDGRIESLNSAAERILGYTTGTLVGRILMDVLFPWGLDAVVATPHAAADHEPPPTTTGWLQAKAKTGLIELIQAQQANGQLIPIELSISETAVGTPKLIVLLRDISERVQLTNALSDKVTELDELNQRLFEVNSSLQRKNDDLQTFVAAAAHDLKTPIRGVASLAEWLETDLDQILTAENQALLRLIRQRTLRMQAIADGLLSYANIDAWVEQQAIVDTRLLVQGICQQIPVPPAFSVQIKGEMPTLRTPHLALTLVFDQLIRNAIAHHDRGQGIVEIIATRQEHCTEFVVRDDGPGIAPVYRDRVLQMFQVLNHNPDTSINIGVGLALVNKTIQLVGGQLDIKAVSPRLVSSPEIGWATNALNAETGSDRGLEVRFTWPLLE